MFAAAIALSLVASTHSFGDMGLQGLDVPLLDFSDLGVACIDHCLEKWDHFGGLGAPPAESCPYNMVFRECLNNYCSSGEQNSSPELTTAWNEFETQLNSACYPMQNSKCTFDACFCEAPEIFCFDGAMGGSDVCHENYYLDYGSIAQVAAAEAAFTDKCPGAESLQNPGDSDGGWWNANSAKKCSAYTAIYECLSGEEASACGGEWAAITQNNWNYNIPEDWLAVYPDDQHQFYYWMSNNFWQYENTIEQYNQEVDRYCFNE